MPTFHFELVSPERLLFSGEVDQVDVPGSEGDFGVLAGHAPFVSTLKPGVLTVYREGGQAGILVLGGFAEVSQQGLTVLADSAVAVEDVDAARLAADIKDAEEDVADATDDAVRDQARRRLEQLRAAQAAIGSGAAAGH